MTNASSAAFTNVIFSDGLLIVHVSGVGIDGCTFQGGTHPTNVAYIDSDDLAEFTNCNFVFSGDGHAIRITATGTYTFDGNLFTGSWGADASADAMIFNDSGGLVTINVGDGGTVTTFRNGSGASTVVNNNVNITMFAFDEAGAGIENVQVAVYRKDDDTELMNEDTLSNGRASASFNFVSNVDIYFRMRKSSSGDPKLISVSGVGTINSNGLNISVTMRQDPNVDV